MRSPMQCPSIAVVAIILGVADALAGTHAPPLVASLSVVDSLKSIVENIMSPPVGGERASADARRAELKDSLLNVCRAEDGPADQKRQKIEEIIRELADVCPTDGTAQSPLLQKRWKLEWTTEKEINAFSDWGISGLVTQTIEGRSLGNLIEFKKGGGLSVSGELSVPDDDEDGRRTYFKFTTAALDLGRWGSYGLPPVGEGWFDTVYLDDALRVDTNSRDDILICTPL